MKIYSSAPDGNEAADMEPAHYFNLAKERLEKSYNHLLQTDKPIQVLLVHIDILIHLSEKYPDMANLLIKKDVVSKWKEGFDNWFERTNSKIPAKYRTEIKESAEYLFSKLNQWGH